MAKASPRAMTRRSLLRMLGAGSAAMAGGAALRSSSFAQSSGVAEEVDVTLTTSGWPYGAMPTAEEQAASPLTKAYADTLQSWLDMNPGVKLELVSFNVWDQEALVTGLAGGTAPAFVQGNVLGGWNDATIRSAMAQGLVADVTDLLEAHQFNAAIADYAKPIWDKWGIGGRYYAAPQSYNVGTGMHYRRDWIQELELQEPTPEWTWDDVRELAKGMTTSSRKGIALQSWGLEGRLASNGFYSLTRLPDPDASWNWRWDFTTRGEEWASHVNAIRAMVFEDQSVLADISFGDGEIRDAFLRGEAGMHNNTVVFYSATPTAPDSIVQLEEQLGKPLDEIVGWIQQPKGANGHSGSTQAQVDLLAFSPDLSEDALDKAVGLHAYMMGPGFVSQKQAVYEATNDLRMVYDWANITPVFGPQALAGLPGTPDEAWGTHFMDAVRAAQDIPLVPKDAWYIPAEATVGPTGVPMDDAFSRWFYEPGDIDVLTDLQQLQETMNQQADGFVSTTPDDEFIAGAREWYAALNEYWKVNAPEFHSSVYSAWYQENIVPVLG